MANQQRWHGIVAATVGLALLVLAQVALAPATTAAAKNTSCHKMTGQVLLTYHNPDTIVMGTGKGMNIATVFTMTPTTAYTRNGVPTNLDGIHYLDIGYISYQAVYPSGTLLACAVVMTGP